MDFSDLNRFYAKLNAGDVPYTIRESTISVCRGEASKVVPYWLLFDQHRAEARKRLRSALWEHVEVTSGKLCPRTPE